MSPAILSFALSLAGVIAGVAVTWGSMQGKIAALREALGELKTELRGSTQRQGDRIGALENNMGIMLYAQRRRDTVLPEAPAGVGKGG